MLSRKFRLKFDLSNYGIFDIPNIHFCLMDSNSSTLYAEILNGGEKLDLTGMTTVLFISKPDGTEVTLNGEDEDYVNGLIRFDLPQQALTIASENYNAEIRIIQEGRCVVTRPFNYGVFENLSSSDLQMLSSSEYVLLVDALRRLSDIESHEESRTINEDVRIENEKQRQISISNAIKNIDSKVQEVNSIKNDFEIILNDKSNMVDGKIVEFTGAMDDIESRFNSLSPEQSANAEVQLARTDITGFKHESLKNRLDRIETQPSVVWETVEG